MAGSRDFAEADWSIDSSKYIILGAPFDATTSFRPGARFAPTEIRKASYNFETYNKSAGIDLIDVPTVDIGDIGEHILSKKAVEEVFDTLKPHTDEGRIPILVGGEHSLTPGAVRAVQPDVYISIDAHLDYRDEYLGDPDSHACSLQRVADIIGKDNVYALGVRSFEKEELSRAFDDGISFYEADDIINRKPESLLKDIIGDAKRPYLSIDIDGIDPAYAPGTGTPEPFGLTDRWVRDLIRSLSPTLAGFDIMEVSPPYDTGNTAALAARLIRDFLAYSWKSYQED